MQEERKEWVESEELPAEWLIFILASNEPSDCLQAFGDCRKSQMLRFSGANLLKS